MYIFSLLEFPLRKFKPRLPLIWKEKNVKVLRNFDCEANNRM